MKIQIATSDDEILQCYPVIHALRGDFQPDTCVKTIRHLQQLGYQLAYLAVSDQPVAIAGFRISESLAWKKYLYVDDLVTLPEQRSKGYGKKLLDWLIEYAADHDCQTFHLDSGVQRKDAHRFYKRENLALNSYHFARKFH